MQLMVFGYLVCLDSFLYIFTILPLQVLLAIFTYIRSLLCGSRFVSNPLPL